jgi:hypothetical protein
MATVKVLPVEIPVEPKPKRATKKAAAKPKEVDSPAVVSAVEVPAKTTKRGSKKVAAATTAVPETTPKARARKPVAVQSPVVEPPVQLPKKRVAKKAVLAAAPVAVEVVTTAKPTRRRTKSV